MTLACATHPCRHSRICGNLVRSRLGQRWFPAVVQMCKENPDMDMGVHATLNAEWESFRWGPISTTESSSGLIDDAGYFHQWHPAVYANARPEAVDVEVNAQVERALAAGIDVTHVDSHMGTILHPNFIESYIQAATKRALPSLLPTLDAVGWNVMANEEQKDAYAPIVEKLESMGVPMLDGILGMPLEHDNDHIGVAKQLFGEAPVGITHFIFHPSIDTA